MLETARVTKTCKGCGESKPLEEFHKTTRTLDGRIARCKICKAKYNNPEKKREYDLVYRAVNRDRRLEGYRKYNDKNAEALAEYRRTPERLEASRASEAKKRAIRAKLPHEPYTIQQIVERDGPQCWMCAKVPEGRDRTVEHLVALQTPADALRQWGLNNPGDVLDNVSIACQGCNSRKSNRIMVCALARYHRNVLASGQPGRN